MIILIIRIIVSYNLNISLIFFMRKMDPMSGFDIRLVFTLPPRDSTLKYRRCVHFWNNFPCITSLVHGMYNMSYVLTLLYQLSACKCSVPVRLWPHSFSIFWLCSRSLRLGRWALLDYVISFNHSFIHLFTYYSMNTYIRITLT